MKPAALLAALFAAMLALAGPARAAGEDMLRLSDNALQAATAPPTNALGAYAGRVSLLSTADFPAAPLTPRPLLEFRRGEGANALPAGALKVQLSESSSIALRPRGGGLALTWRARY